MRLLSASKSKTLKRMKKKKLISAKLKIHFDGVNAGAGALVSSSSRSRHSLQHAYRPHMMLLKLSGSAVVPKHALGIFFYRPTSYQRHHIRLCHLMELQATFFSSLNILLLPLVSCPCHCWFYCGVFFYSIPVFRFFLFFSLSFWTDFYDIAVHKILWAEESLCIVCVLLVLFHVSQL